MHFQVLLYNDVTWIKLVELFYQIYITIIAKNIIINFLYILPHIYHMLVLHTYTQTHTVTIKGHLKNPTSRHNMTLVNPPDKSHRCFPIRNDSSDIPSNLTRQVMYPIWTGRSIFGHQGPEARCPDQWYMWDSYYRWDTRKWSSG